MRIYLDTSVYNRPFDDQWQPRIWLEALALGVILQIIAAGERVLNPVDFVLATAGDNR